MPEDVWNVEQYERFAAEREAPVHDLLKLFQPAPVEHAVDLGCGTGAPTVLLHRHIGSRDTLGLDSSESMLAKAAALAIPGLRFERRDIESFSATAAFDVVFSNAALHWVGDHESLFEKLRASLRPGGQLLVQMPTNFDHPSHTVAKALAEQEPYAQHLQGQASRAFVHPSAQYAQWLFDLGFAQQHVSERVYAHVLPNADAVVEWVRGTLFTDVEKRLPPALFLKFEDDYRRDLHAALAEKSPYLFTFKRLLLWARV